MDTKNKLLKVNGLIIREEDYKEYDKLLTILTKELGKIKVYAFGVRKQNSKNIGKARLFTFSTFDIRKIAAKYQLESSSLVESFEGLASDYAAICYASYFIELSDYFSFENIESEEVYKLLYYTFKALSEKKMSFNLIRRVYELKMLEYEGVYKESTAVPTKLKYTWDYILNNKDNKLYSFTLINELEELLSAEIDLEYREKVGRKFKTLEMIR